MSANIEVEYAGNFQVGIQRPRECFAGRFLLEQNLLRIAFKQTGDTGEEPIGFRLTQVDQLLRLALFEEEGEQMTGHIRRGNATSFASTILETTTVLVR